MGIQLARGSRRGRSTTSVQLLHFNPHNHSDGWVLDVQLSHLGCLRAFLAENFGSVAVERLLLQTHKVIGTRNLHRVVGPKEREPRRRVLRIFSS